MEMVFKNNFFNNVIIENKGNVNEQFYLFVVINLK